jgi:glycerol-3-phosphate dehydrogenase
MIKKLDIDIAIVGGGVAGLWALNRLQALGYQVVLLEAHTLGGGQTIHSQGIIHGGVKYALKGFLSTSSASIESMPKRWGECLQGHGEIDLSSVNILSNQQLLWSTGSIASELTNFFASFALKSRVDKLKPQEYPLLFQNPAFKGHIYRLNELVVDVSSLIEALVKPCIHHIVKAKPSVQYSVNSASETFISHLVLNNKEQHVHLSAKRYLFMAGEGNADLTAVNAPLMQRRPLHMVLLQLKQPHPLFAHCLEQGANPRITITSHTKKNGQCVWYLGGKLAEEGIYKTEAEQIKYAQSELKSLFPWLDLTHSQWASFIINRAEPKQANDKRPDSFFSQPLGNAIISWPTKLALAPLLTDNIIETLQAQTIMPSTPSGTEIPTLLDWADIEKPSIALPIWDEIFQ